MVRAIERDAEVAGVVGLAFIAGVRRGGFVGWAETGFNPIAGLFMLFGGSKLLQGAQEKARQKIKDLYGVDITDRKVLQQIVDIAKQSYGSNIDMAIRTAQVRDLIQLFAMSTGQTTKGMPPTMQPLSLVQSGGSLYQMPNYSNGSALPGLAGLPSLDSIGGGVATNAGPVVRLPWLTPRAPVPPNRGLRSSEFFPGSPLLGPQGVFRDRAQVVLRNVGSGCFRAVPRHEGLLDVPRPG